MVDISAEYRRIWAPLPVGVVGSYVSSMRHMASIIAGLTLSVACGGSSFSGSDTTSHYAGAAGGSSGDSTPGGDQGQGGV